MGLEESFTDEESSTTPVTQAPAAQPAPVAQPPVQQAPVEVKTEPAVVAPAPVAAPVAPVAEAAAVVAQGQDRIAGAQPPASVSEPAEGQQFENLAKAVQEHRAVLEGALAEKVYALTDEERVALDTDPGTALPKFMAKLHMEITQNVLGVIAQNLPPTIHGVLAAQRRNDEAAEEFWQAWPELNKTAHLSVVKQIGAQVAQLNPTMDRKSRIQQIGQLAVMQLGLLPQAQARLMGQKPAPVAPQNVQQPFAPAMGRATVPAGTPTGAENLFAEMNMIMEADDR